MTGSRKPAHLEMIGGKPPRQHMWQAIREKRESFTCYQIARRAKQEDSAVKAYLDCLRLGGYIEPTRPFARGEEVSYRLVRDNGIEAPNLTSKGTPSRKGYRAEAMWRTLRILGRATPEQVAAQVSATGSTVEPASVTRYFRDLELAGYLARDGNYYALHPRRYTGPRPPMVRRTEGRQVYDPNLDKIVWDSTTQPSQSREPTLQELTWMRIENEQLRSRLAEALGLLEDWVQHSHSSDDAHCSLAVTSRSLIDAPQVEVRP